MANKSVKPAWLVSWNVKAWDWDDYDKACADTRRGKTYTRGWACVSKGPKIGDEVFLIKLGERPRGIIGHGIVVGEPYDDTHFNADLASAGDIARFIDIEFDRIINYQTAEILSQETLKKKCSKQYWSPQNSGVSIKAEVIKTLHLLWNEVIENESPADSYEPAEVSKEASLYSSKNMILYGPPGTGKTYNSVNYAVAICEGKAVFDIQKEPYDEVLARFNELKKNGRIEFTTFHQSYGYEEFIEGIKPVLNDEGNLSYTIEDGVFKSFCERARTAPDLQEADLSASVWFVTLKDGSDNNFKRACFKDGFIRIKREDDSDWVKWRIGSMRKGDYVISDGGHGVYFDAIGVITDDEPSYDENAATYSWFRHVEWLVTGIQEDIRPINGNKLLPRFDISAMKRVKVSDLLEIVDKVKGKRPIVNTAPYVFIIDEINRGNISKIFGELITLIEDTKRSGAAEEMAATLPYSGETFSVPGNVYIVGTMNTADRSIALMDTALRRRFEFVEMMPDPEVLQSLGVGTISVDGETLNVKMMLYMINQRIEYLYDREHTIGHAFFTKLADDPSIDTLAEIFEKHVIPLLQEYFYDDYEKIQLVLGDNGKEDQYKFIRDEAVKVKNVFNGNPDIDLPEKRYTIQKSALYKIQSYKGIAAEL